MPQLRIILTTARYLVLVWLLFMAASAPAQSQSLPPGADLLEAAHAERWVSETGGAASVNRIQTYLAVHDGEVRPISTAWCSAFVAFIAKRRGRDITHANLAARSWLNVGIPVAQPMIGDVIVIWRVSPDSWQGHVGFYVDETKVAIAMLAGNESDGVRIEWYPKSRVLGYRRLL